ncbi:MAG: hypothetical protein HYS18_11550 [Burkholderiales bacterium]|nr:hypothetical protein [Burkholderiales bacterium]
MKIRQRKRLINKRKGLPRKFLKDVKRALAEATSGNLAPYAPRRLNENKIMTKTNL